MTKFQYLLHLGKIAVPAAETDSVRARTQKKLQKVVSRSHEPIVTARTVFPFDLFPDSIIVDRTKLTIINRIFFFVEELVTIDLEDVLNVTSSIGPFFGSLQIHTRFFEASKPYQVNYLWRKDALRIERIIQGYNIALKEKMDLSALEAQDLADMLDELGRETYL